MCPHDPTRCWIWFDKGVEMMADFACGYVGPRADAP